MPPRKKVDVDLEATTSTDMTALETASAPVESTAIPVPTGCLSNKKSKTILQSYSEWMGIGGFANITPYNRPLSVAQMRQIHSQFLAWLIANKVVTLNEDVVAYMESTNSVKVEDI